MTYETWVKDFQEKNNRLPYADEVFEAGKENAELKKENELLQAKIASLEEALDIEHGLGKDAAGEIQLYQIENAELRKRIEEYNLCGNTVDKQTYNEVVNENTLLKVKIQNVTNFINACKRSSIASMIKSILDETIFQEAGEK